MTRVLLVALGGAVGSTLRYLLGLAIVALAGEGWLPIPTLTVNVLGSFALGLAMTVWPEPSLGRLAVTTGVLGGFTTYSAFNFETWEFARHRELSLAIGYVAVTVVACLLAGAAGAWVGDRLR